MGEFSNNRRKKMSLAGKVIIVTGAGSGIGKAVAVALAKEGGKVGLVGRDGSRLKEVQKQVERSGGQAFAVATDVVDRNAVMSMRDEVEQKFGAVDMLVNNAGLSVWQYMVNMSSVRGVTAGTGGAVYGGTKHFIEGLSNGLRQEVAGKGVRVSTMQPSLVDTPLISMNLEGGKDGQGADKEAVQDRKNAMEGMKGSLLTPEDVARSVVFLLSQPEHCTIPQLPLHACAQQFK